METFIKKARIVSYKEIRDYCKQNNITEEDTLKEVLAKNPSKFHKQAVKAIRKIFHP